jgi:hypothetical protein
MIPVSALEQPRIEALGAQVIDGLIQPRPVKSSAQSSYFHAAQPFATTAPPDPPEGYRALSASGLLPACFCCYYTFFVSAAAATIQRHTPIFTSGLTKSK